MTPQQLSDALVAALTSLVEAGTLSVPGGVPATVTVERPRNKEHGDYATNVALQLGKKAGFTNPRELAQLLADELQGFSRASRASTSPAPASSTSPSPPPRRDRSPPTWSRPGRPTGAVTRSPESGSTSSSSRPTRPVRCTSGTPAGPPWVTRSRGCWTPPERGWRVEFYINDRGNQMDLFGASVAAAAEVEIAADGYHGGYVKDLAARVVEENPDLTELTGEERLVAFREAAYAVQLAEQQEQLETFNTHFDVWFSERSLHEDDSVTRNIEKLRGQGHLFEDDGALWMRTTDAATTVTAC